MLYTFSFVRSSWSSRLLFTRDRIALGPQDPCWAVTTAGALYNRKGRGRSPNAQGLARYGPWANMATRIQISEVCFCHEWHPPRTLQSGPLNSPLYNGATMLEVRPCVMGGPMVKHHFAIGATVQSIHGPVCFQPPTLHPQVLLHRRL